MKSTFEDDGSQQESELEGGGLKIEEEEDSETVDKEVNENALLIMIAPFAKAFNLTNEATLLNSDLNNNETVGDDNGLKVEELEEILSIDVSADEDGERRKTADEADLGPQTSQEEKLNIDVSANDEYESREGADIGLPTSKEEMLLVAVQAEEESDRSNLSEYQTPREQNRMEEIVNLDIEAFSDDVPIMADTGNQSDQDEQLHIDVENQGEEKQLTLGLSGSASNIFIQDSTLILD